MAAANSLPPWVTMYRTVLPVERVEEWGEIICPRRKAYGCGEHGQKLVDGLTLLARFIDGPNFTTYLRIRLNDQAVQIMQAEFGMRGDEPPLEIGDRGLCAGGSVQHAGDGFIVVALWFSVGYYDDRIYYLVYNASGLGSLSLTRHVPQYCLSSLTPTALPVRREDGGVHLLLLARVSRPGELEEQGLFPNDVVLCSCPPSSPSSASIGPWQLQKQRFVDQVAPKLFSRRVSFSFQGQAFWVDLTKGVVVCCGFGDSSQPRFDFIPLPEEFQLDYHTLEVPVMNHPDPMEIPVAMVRTMGYVDGGSLMFVSIGHSGPPHERMVTVLEHHLDDERRRFGWTQAFKFSVNTLWNLQGFKTADLPHGDPKCPVLAPDGALCFQITTKGKITADGTIKDDHFCIL